MSTPLARLGAKLMKQDARREAREARKDASNEALEEAAGHLELAWR